MKGIFTLPAFLLLLFFSVYLNAQITTSSQWTWMKGDSTINSSGVYGTKGVSAASNKPGARQGSATWTDASGNFWLFGGRGNDAVIPPTRLLLNDLWKYDLATNEWTWVSGDSIAEKKGIYGTIGVADPANKPGGRTVSVSWTDAVGNLWLFGGNGYAASGSSSLNGLNDLWKYTPATNQWTWVKGDSITDRGAVYGIQGTAALANKPGSRYGATTWADNAGNFFLFGGQGIAGGNISSLGLSDLWKYSTATNQWTWLKGDTTTIQFGVYGVKGTPALANKPGGRVGGLASKDTAGNLWLFGGQGSAASSYGSLNDLWKYSPATNQWAWMSGDNITNQQGIYGTQEVAATTNKPGSRYYGYKWTDAAGNFWLLGGIGYASSGNSRLNDLWKYDLLANQWTWVKGDSTIDKPGVYGAMGTAGIANKPGARAIGVTWTDASGNFWLFGGNSPINTLNDLWKLNITSAGFMSISNGNWDSPSTWSGGVVPSASSAVIVRHTVAVQANASCYSLRVEGPNGFVTVATGVQFAVLH